MLQLQQARRINKPALDYSDDGLTLLLMKPPNSLASVWKRFFTQVPSLNDDGYLAILELVCEIGIRFVYTPEQTSEHVLNVDSIDYVNSHWQVSLNGFALHIVADTRSSLRVFASSVNDRERPLPSLG